MIGFYKPLILLALTLSTGWAVLIQTPPDPGTVTGEVCYPGAETPPMVVYVENAATGERFSQTIERGQPTYTIEAAPGESIAYAHTVGRGLRGSYTCAGAEGLCPFTVEAGETSQIDLCEWYETPGLVSLEGEAVTVQPVQNLNLRAGPHLSFEAAGLVEAGRTLTATARTPAGDWLQVEGGWAYAPLVQVRGDPESLPGAEADAPPATADNIQFTPAIWRSSNSRGMVWFHGEIRDERGRPVNGYSILLDNGTWSVLSHPSGASEHYPDVRDGAWDLIIDNETDAAGWWAMTVVRYDCPDFEGGFNAQCKDYTPLSETKLVQVVHPDDNVIEANWTCLEDCGEGVYRKPFRRPVPPLDDDWLLYSEDRALKSSPVSPAFDAPEMKALYDDLPATPDGLRAFLAENPPRLAPNYGYLLVNSPLTTTYIAQLFQGDILELDHFATAAAWSPDSEQLAYVTTDTLYLTSVISEPFTVSGTTALTHSAALSDAHLSWTGAGLTLRSGSGTWRVSSEAGTLRPVTLDPRPETVVAAELWRQGLPQDAPWALSQDGQKVAYSVPITGPLHNAIFITDRETGDTFEVGPINGYRVAELRWTTGDDELLIGATNPKLPSGGAIFIIEPKPDQLPEVVLESDTAYLVEIWPAPGGE